MMAGFFFFLLLVVTTKERRKHYVCCVFVSMYMHVVGRRFSVFSRKTTQEEKGESRKFSESDIYVYYTDVWPIHVAPYPLISGTS